MFFFLPPTLSLPSASQWPQLITLRVIEWCVRIMLRICKVVNYRSFNALRRHVITFRRHVITLRRHVITFVDQFCPSSCICFGFDWVEDVAPAAS